MSGILSQGQAEPAPQAQQQQEPQESGLEEEVPESEDQALMAAYQWVHNKLYAEGVGDKISEVAKSLEGIEGTLANIAYKLAQGADTATDGNIAEENLVPLGVFVLNEVFEIAEASGAKVGPEAVNSAFKKLIVLWLQDNGQDTTQLEQAMDQVGDADFAQVANEAMPEQQGAQNV
jgi:hypothetical protein